MSRSPLPAAAPHDVRYPIGKHHRLAQITAADRKLALDRLAGLPQELASATQGLGDSQLDTPYREGGWTVRQVVHHVADSHSQLSTRVRWTLTESEPMIKVYEEGLWAELKDARTAPIDWSLALVANTHRRVLDLLGSLTDPQWQRGYVHPVNGFFSIDQAVQMYAWHGRHHVAHITNLRQAHNW